MTNGTKHTHTPWRYQCEVGNEPGRRPVRSFQVYTDNGLYGNPCTCDKENDAAFIVRACNCHYDLVEACKLLLKANEQLMPGLRHIAVQDYALLNNAPTAARAAIAKAEAGE